VIGRQILTMNIWLVHLRNDDPENSFKNIKDAVFIIYTNNLSTRHEISYKRAFAIEQKKKLW
jgi:hypothetical protein